MLLNVFATETVIDETTGKENKFKLQKKKNDDDARLQFQHQKQMYSRVIKKDEMLLHNTKEISITFYGSKDHPSDVYKFNANTTY